MTPGAPVSQGDEAPRISIIIPTRNRVDRLTMCLENIIKQTTDVPLVEVIVCDDSDDDLTRNLIESRFSYCQWIKGPGRGPGPNRNTGAAVATGDLLVFADDDCLPQAGWLRAYSEVLNEEAWTNTIYAGPIRWPGGIPSLAWEAPLNESATGIPSCNFAIPRERFLQIGGFDERYFPAFEDTELHARLLATEVQVVFLPRAEVHHPPRRIPDAASLAARWYPQVIYAIDLGAPPERLYLPYLRHVLGTTLAWWKGGRVCIENFALIPKLLVTLVLVAVQLPGWITKAATLPRSKFWASSERRCCVPGFGFGARIQPKQSDASNGSEIV